MSTGIKILIGVLVALLVLGVTCVGGITAFGIWFVNNTPEGIMLDFDYPDNIVVGDEFEVTITVENLFDETRMLYELDFYNPILDGVSIISFDPPPATDDGQAIFGSRTIAFNQQIPAEGEVVIVVTMAAEQAGYYTGDVDVSIDGILSIHSTTQTLVIDEAP